jgi:C1A family cysteine protease
MKVFVLCFALVVVVAGDGATNVRPNHDCSCKGYEAKAAECKWPEAIKKCDPASKEYKTYFFWCEKLNNFRDDKREGTRPNNYNRTLTCDSYKTEKERRKEKCGLKVEKGNSKRSLPIGSIPTSSPTPTSANWTASMTPIKNQGGCGSCWAFASTGLCEHHLKSVKQETILSEQQMVDCDLSNGGCNGGWPTKSLTYMNTTGLANSAYVYKAVRAANCSVPKPYAIVKRCPKPITEYYAAGNDARLRQVLAKTPVLGAMNVISSFYQYRNGIYTPANGTCSAAINHAIMIVGYGTDSITKQKYWICRNSWGTGWGERGYFKIDANKANQCGISTWFWYY